MAETLAVYIHDGHTRDMNTTRAAQATLKLSKIEDHEGFGHCGECGRDGLRWIAVLSDGSSVGMECAKKVMGWKPAPKSYSWVADFAPVAEFTYCNATFVMWQHKNGTQTRETQNGSLVQVGGVRADWERKGWL